VGSRSVKQGGSFYRLVFIEFFGGKKFNDFKALQTLQNFNLRVLGQRATLQE